MANETPKKPIRRTTVPTVSKKEVPSKLPSTPGESKATQNALLFFLFLIISAIVYLAIFQRPLLSKYIFRKKNPTESTVAVSDTLLENTTDSLSQDEVNTFIGQDKPGAPKVYPAGSRYYLVAGTFIFYPYAEKRRDLLKSEGYEADIISTGENRKFHRVYIQSSEDGAAVRAQRDELRSSKNMDVWVYVE